ncbi:MAG: hypothetical protein ACYC9L_14385 [Sulfuricaulis sp.]
MTRFIDTLEDRGYLKRSKIGREQIISPTPAATKLKEELNRRGDDLYRRMHGGLGKSALVGLVRELPISSKLHTDAWHLGSPLSSRE